MQFIAQEIWNAHSDGNRPFSMSRVENTVAKGDIAIVGLPSAGLRKLTSNLDIPVSEDIEVLRVFRNPHGAKDHTPDWMISGMVKNFHENNTGNKLIVYQTPWEFLEQQMVNVFTLQDTHAQLPTLAKHVLKLWYAYHESLIEVRHKRSNQFLLINGDRPIDIEAIAALINKRFGFSPRVKQNSVTENKNITTDIYGPAYRQIVDTLAPECLELYIAMESCAELIGHELNLKSNESAEQEARVAAMLQLAARQYRLNDNSWQRDLEMLATDSQLNVAQGKSTGQELELSQKISALEEKLTYMQNEATLHLLLINQLQEELEGSIAEQERLRIELKVRSGL